MRAILPWIAAATLISGCATTQPPVDAQPSAAQPLSQSATSCSDGTSTIDKDFAGGGFATCQLLGDGHYKLLIRQEDPKVINCSAWYAFRVRAADETPIRVDLDYEKCGHRYQPKVWVAKGGVDGSGGSTKGQANTPGRKALWTRLNPKSFMLSGTGKGEIAQASLNLTASPTPQIIAAQELLLPADYQAWMDHVEGLGTVERSELGRSLEGNPIEMLRLPATNKASGEQLVVIGRQHPPEVTGGYALFAFVERLLEDDDLARRYRARFTTSIVPILNPDGVLRGHWRHSKGERDLNRDWGPFTQPETRLVRDLTEAMEADPTKNLRFFMDFHSTGRDILYTLDKSLVTNPPGFTDAWITDYQSRLPGYSVTEQPGHNPESPVSKGWAFERFGIPSMTYEIGDETDRGLIRQLGRAAAEATMTTLLAHDEPAS